VEYAIHLQRDRRNMTDADIARFVMELDRRKAVGRPEKIPQSCGINGKSAAITAEVIGTSQSKVEKVRDILNHAAEETKAEVLAGARGAIPGPLAGFLGAGRCLHL
jgi:ParB family chromosome partitioning protein